MHLRLSGLWIETRRVASLSEAALDEIWAFADDYTDATREGFMASLSQKRDVVLIRARRHGPLGGIGAVAIVQAQVEGRLTTLLFPGDVVLSPQVRGHSLVEQIGFLYYLRELARRPSRPVMMLFGTFSYRSYLMLPRSFVDYWPRPEHTTPPALSEAMREVASRFYTELVERAPGVTTASTTKRLRAHVAPITPQLRDNPHVAFFEAHNPHHTEGHVMICAVPLTARNWMGALRQLR